MAGLPFITYLADTDDRITDDLLSYFKNLGFHLVQYQFDKHPSEVFLVFSPLWNGSQYLSVEGVWACYLAKDFPNTKMVVAGSIQSDNPNYVNLLRMPEDWIFFLEKAPVAAHFKPESPVFVGGVDMVKRLKQFLSGHGNESMAEACGSLRYKLDLLVKPLERDENGSMAQKIIQIMHDDTTQERWRAVRTRWLNHSPFFQFLPFSETFTAIGILLEDLRVVFEDTHVEDIKVWLLKAISSLSNLQAHLNYLYHYVEEQT